MSTPSVAVTQRGIHQVQQFNTVRTSGAFSRTLHLFDVRGRAAAAEMNGLPGHYKGWFVDSPARTWQVIHGTLEDLAAIMGNHHDMRNPHHIATCWECQAAIEEQYQDFCDYRRDALAVTYSF
jgi:thioesterase domain-containing protein